MNRNKNHNRSAFVSIERKKHRGQTIYLFRFSGRPMWLQKIKSLKNIQFSKTYGSWYVPNGLPESTILNHLRIPFKITETHDSEKFILTDTVISGADHDHTGIWGKTLPATSLSSPDSGNGDIQDPAQVQVSWTIKGFIIDFQYSSKFVQQVKKLEGAWWNQKYKKWLCKNSLGNLKKIQDNWNVWNEEEYDKWFGKISQSVNPCIIKIYYSPKYPEEVCVQIIGYGSNHAIIKKFAGRRYLKEEKTYLVPGEKNTIEEIVNQYSDVGYTIENRLSSYIQKSKKVTEPQKVGKFLSNYQGKVYGLLKKYADTLIRTGYGYKTTISYTGKIARILAYYEVENMEDINADQVNRYLSMMVENGSSYSLVNQVYSAVKFYHDRVAFTSHFDMFKLSRPKKRFKLPKFLSESEVYRMMESIENLKHLAVLYLLYGAGLRRGELLNIQLKHLYWDRNQILIEDGKGKKDRMVNLSTEMKTILDLYIQEYKPAIFLFESNTVGKPYSASSVRAIIKKAADNAGISKRVTPHVLRHSFATHLMDRGIVLPKIQKLLGHKDVRTTMIYTHLTKKGIEEVESPLDALLRKKRNKETENVHK